MTKAQRERLAQIKTRISTTRDERAQARQAMAAAEGLWDADAVALAQAKIDATESDLAYLTGLENAALSSASPGSSLRRHAGQQPGRAAGARGDRGELRTASLERGDRPVQAIDDVVNLTGGALRAALDVPDCGGQAGFLGITPTPQAPTSLLDFFTSVPFDEWRASLRRGRGPRVTMTAPVNRPSAQAAPDRDHRAAFLAALGG